MPVYWKSFNENIKLLNDIDCSKFSVVFNKKNQLVPEEKRSCFKNFINHSIHLITFTLVPRNAK